MTIDIIKETEQYVKKIHLNDFTGHDYAHINRVRKIALNIGKEEGADLFIVEMAALLHDTVDSKLVDESVAYRHLYEFLNSIQLRDDIQQAILHILRNVSYKNGSNHGKLQSLEGQVVQDADRIDALGAIGIARTFMFAGHFNEPMHDESLAPFKKDHNGNSTAINHFYEKLFLLKDLMNTTTGKYIAQERTAYMVDFVEHFKKEWQI